MPLGGTGVGVGVAVGVGVGVGGGGVGVGLGTGVGVGVGVGDAATVTVSADEKKNPVESHARTVIACLPAVSEITAVSEAFVLFAFCTESIYMIIAVTVCSLSSAAALKVTGELTVAPLAGEQIFTVLSTVAVQVVCAEARFAQRKKSKSRVADAKIREDIRGP
jgi:hypothetical protein